MKNSEYNIHVPHFGILEACIGSNTKLPSFNPFLRIVKSDNVILEGSITFAEVFTGRLFDIFCLFVGHHRSESYFDDHNKYTDLNKYGFLDFVLLTFILDSLLRLLPLNPKSLLSKILLTSAFIVLGLIKYLLLAVKYIIAAILCVVLIPLVILPLAIATYFCRKSLIEKLVKDEATDDRLILSNLDFYNAIARFPKHTDLFIERVVSNKATFDRIIPNFECLVTAVNQFPQRAEAFIMNWTGNGFMDLTSQSQDHLYFVSATHMTFISHIIKKSETLSQLLPTSHKLHRFFRLSCESGRTNFHKPFVDIVLSNRDLFYRFLNGCPQKDWQRFRNISPHRLELQYDNPSLAADAAKNTAEIRRAARIIAQGKRTIESPFNNVPRDICLMIARFSAVTKSPHNQTEIASRFLDKPKKSAGPQMIART